MLLRLSRVRPTACQFFDSIVSPNLRAGTLDAVKSLLKEGRGSVVDVDINGRSALHVGVVVTVVNTYTNMMIEGTESEKDQSSFGNIALG